MCPEEFAWCRSGLQIGFIPWVRSGIGKHCLEHCAVRLTRATVDYWCFLWGGRRKWQTETQAFITKGSQKVISRFLLKITNFALASVAQLVVRHPTNWKVASLISLHCWSGHMLGLQGSSLFGASAGGNQSVSLSHQCFSPFLSPSFSLSLKSKIKF